VQNLRSARCGAQVLYWRLGIFVQKSNDYYLACILHTQAYDADADAPARNEANKNTTKLTQEIP